MKDKKKIIDEMYEKYAVKNEGEGESRENTPWDDDDVDAWRDDLLGDSDDEGEKETKSKKKFSLPFGEKIVSLFPFRRKKEGKSSDETDGKDGGKRKKIAVAIAAASVLIGASAYLLTYETEEPIDLGAKVVVVDGHTSGPVSSAKKAVSAVKGKSGVSKDIPKEISIEEPKGTDIVFTDENLSAGKEAAKERRPVVATAAKGGKKPVVSGDGNKTRKERVKAATLYSLEKGKSVKITKSPDKMTEKEIISAIKSIPDDKIDVAFKKYSNERINNAIMRYKKELEKRFKEECEARKAFNPVASKRPSVIGVGGRVPVTVSTVKKNVKGGKGFVSVVKTQTSRTSEGGPFAFPSELKELKGLSVLGGKRKDLRAKRKPPKPPWINLRITGYACDGSGCYVWSDSGRLRKGDVIGGSFKVLSVEKGAVKLGMIYEGKIAETRTIKFGS